MGTMIVNLYPAHLTEVRHDVLYEAVSILLLVREQLQRIDQSLAWTLKYCMRFEDLGWLTLAPVCTTRTLFGAVQSNFSLQIAHHQFVCFFLP